MEICDTIEEAVNVNKTTLVSVEETQPFMNTDNTENSGNTIVFICEASKVSKTDTNFKIFICDQCNCTNSYKKG